MATSQEYYSQSYMTDIMAHVWDNSHEQVIAELAEESQVAAYLHRMAYEYFNRRNMKFQLPVIILSVFSGSANFVSANFPEVQKYIVIGVGGLSILTSIISSVSQYLKLGEAAEGHRLCYYQYEKLYSRLNIHLHMKREDRDPPVDFIKAVQVEYLRLKELSPDIPPLITHAAKVKHRRTLATVQSPVVISGFKPVKPYGTEIDVDRIPFPVDVTPNRHMSLASPPLTPSASSKC